MNETTWKKEWDIILRPIPAAELEKITKGGLQQYWHVAMAHKGAIATCVNCARIVKIRPNGLCGSCEAAGINHTGPALLDALLECRSRMQTPESQRVAAWIKKGKAGSKQSATTLPGEKMDCVAKPPSNRIEPAPQQPMAIAQGAVEVAGAVSEIIHASPLAALGMRYIKFGELLQDTNTSLVDLTAAAHELGLRLEISIEVVR